MSQGVVTSIPLCDIDTNVSVSPFNAAVSIWSIFTYSNDIIVQLIKHYTVIIQAIHNNNSYISYTCYKEISYQLTSLIRWTACYGWQEHWNQ